MAPLPPNPFSEFVEKDIEEHRKNVERRQLGLSGTPAHRHTHTHKQKKHTCLLSAMNLCTHVHPEIGRAQLANTSRPPSPSHAERHMGSTHTYTHSHVRAPSQLGNSRCRPSADRSSFQSGHLKLPAACWDLLQTFVSGGSEEPEPACQSAAPLQVLAQRLMREHLMGCSSNLPVQKHPHHPGPVRASPPPPSSLKQYLSRANHVSNQSHRLSVGNVNREQMKGVSTGFCCARVPTRLTRPVSLVPYVCGSPCVHAGGGGPRVDSTI